MPCFLLSQQWLETLMKSKLFKSLEEVPIHQHIDQQPEPPTPKLIIHLAILTTHMYITAMDTTLDIIVTTVEVVVSTTAEVDSDASSASFSAFSAAEEDNNNR